MTFQILKQTDLPRRSVLKGAGALLGLPLLDAMLPENGLAADTSGKAAPLRMAFVFFPNGAIMPDWTPKQDGASYELSKTLKPLEPFKSDINVMSGLAQDNGRAKGDGPGDHARSASTFLTGAHPRKTAGADTPPTPTESRTWTPLTNAPSRSMRSSAARPIRVIRRMLVTT